MLPCWALANTLKPGWRPQPFNKNYTVHNRTTAPNIFSLLKHVCVCCGVQVSQTHVPVKEKVKKTSKSHISYRMTSLTALALPSVGDFLCLTRYCILQLLMLFRWFVYRHFKESHNKVQSFRESLKKLSPLIWMVCLWLGRWKGKSWILYT